MSERHIPSERLQGLAPHAAELGFLAMDDGFWADLVLSEFEFLEGLGYAVQAVSFHQQGDSIVFRGPHGSITFEFFPDGKDISGQAQLSGGLLSFEGDLDALARLEEPHATLPAKLPLDRRTIERNVSFWADVLRAGRRWL